MFATLEQKTKDAKAIKRNSTSRMEAGAGKEDVISCALHLLPICAQTHLNANSKVAINQI